MNMISHYKHHYNVVLIVITTLLDKIIEDEDIIMPCIYTHTLYFVTIIVRVCVCEFLPVSFYVCVCVCMCVRVCVCVILRAFPLVPFQLPRLILPLLSCCRAV